MKGSRKAVLCFWDGSDDFGGRGCAKEKFLYYIVVPGLAVLHEVGDGDAI